MKKHWKCKLGLHDLERISDRKGIDRDNDGRGPWDYDKVCIRPGCNKFSLEATEKRIARAQVKFDVKDRKDIANEKAKLHIIEEELG